MHLFTKKKKYLKISFFAIALAVLSAFMMQNSDSTGLKITEGSHIILIGNNLGSRMMNYGYFET